ncbi:hypothetical protein [Ferrovibrio sp.]|uniref:hypothetical protein n=1 Tax=Ferrovibrio sp. TaxID=1917215 RepID=UPI0035B13FE2
MANIVIASQMDMQGSTISCGPLNSSSRPGDLLHREPNHALVLIDPAQLFVTVQLTQPKPIRMIAGLYAGLSMNGYWRVRAASAAADLLAAPEYDTGMQPFAAQEEGFPHRLLQRHDWIWSPSPLTYRYWRFDFSDASLPLGRLILGKIILAHGFQPQFNYSYDAVEPYLFDPSRTPRAAAGQRDPLNKQPYDRSGFSLDYLNRTEAKRDQRKLSEFVGVTRPVFVAFDPDEQEYRQGMSTYGLLTELQPISLPIYKRFRTRYEIEELIP